MLGKHEVSKDFKKLGGFKVILNLQWWPHHSEIEKLACGFLELEASISFSQKSFSGSENLSDIGSLGHIKNGIKMTSLMKPDDSWRHDIPKKYLCGISRALTLPKSRQGWNGICSLSLPTGNSGWLPLDGSERERLRHGGWVLYESPWGMVTHPKHSECSVGSGRDEEGLCVPENWKSNCRRLIVYTTTSLSRITEPIPFSYEVSYAAYIPQLHPLRRYHLVVWLAPSLKRGITSYSFVSPTACVTQQMFDTRLVKKIWIKRLLLTSVSIRYPYSLKQLCELGTIILMLKMRK